MEMPKAINIQTPMGNSKDNDLSKQVKNIVQSSGKTLWSYSRLSKFHSCKYEYYLQYIAKNRNGRNNVYAVLGDIVHQCLEGFIKGEYNREQMLQKFETIYSSTKIPTLNQTVLLQFPSEKIEKTYIECIRIFLKNYIPAKADKILLEEFLWHLFGGNQKIAVQGYADCILCFNEDNTVIIDDFKTSTKFNKDDLLEKGRQLVMYAYMYQKRTGIPVKMVRWLMLKYWEVSFPTVLKQLKDKSVKELKEFLSNNNINEKLKKEEMINKCLHLDLSEFINIHDVNKIVYQKNELSLKVSKEFVKLLEAYGIDKDTINRNLSILQNENSFMMLEPVVQEILNKFNFNAEDWYCEYHLTDDIYDEMENYIINTVNEIENTPKCNTESEIDFYYPKLDDNGMFYCANLCSFAKDKHGNVLCKHYQKYLDESGL